APSTRPDRAPHAAIAADTRVAAKVMRSARRGAPRASVAREGGDDIHRILAKGGATKNSPLGALEISPKLAEHHRDIVLQVAGWKRHRLDQRLDRCLHIARARERADRRSRGVLQEAIGGDQEAPRDRLAADTGRLASAAADQGFPALRGSQIDY